MLLLRIEASINFKQPTNSSEGNFNQNLYKNSDRKSTENSIEESKKRSKKSERLRSDNANKLKALISILASRLKMLANRKVSLD